MLRRLIPGHPLPQHDTHSFPFGETLFPNCEKLTRVTGMSGTAYTHGYAESVLDSHRGRTAQNSAAHLLPHLRPGSTLLDVGSGAGTITADLATLVAPGWVTALEMSTEALDLTRAELDRQGRSGVDLVVGDVHSLDFASDSFDVVHAHQVLQHVTDPVAALREMIRVCRPGRASAPGAPTGAASGERGGGIGLVAARDADYAEVTTGWRLYPLSDVRVCVRVGSKM